MCWGFNYTYENIATKECKKIRVADIKGLKEFFGYYNQPLDGVVEDEKDLEDEEICLCGIIEKPVVDLVIAKIMVLVYGHDEKEIPKRIVDEYDDAFIRYKEISDKINFAIGILDSYTFNEGDVSIS